MLRLLFLLVCCFHAATPLFAQDSLLIKALQANRLEFQHAPTTGFQGAGWDKVLAEAKANQYFLIGEIHGINELPLLVKALAEKEAFQTYVSEVDPWLAAATEEQMRLSPEKRQQWYAHNGEYLSFYSYQNEFKMLQSLVERNMHLAGLDQVAILADVPVYRYLAEHTKDKSRKARYTGMAEASARMLQAFNQALTEKKEPKISGLYLMSDQFLKDAAWLRAQKLPADEKEALDALELSRQIYNGPKGHQKRINLMMHQLMQYYSKGWLSGKTMFRLGAVHSGRNESMFTIFDVGNLAHDLAASQFSTSYHVAVLARQGEAASPFKSQPPRRVEPEKGWEAFTDQASRTSWTYFDLRPAREQLEKHKLEITDDKLRRFIKGYDAVIIVPNATPGQF